MKTVLPCTKKLDQKLLDVAFKKVIAKNVMYQSVVNKIEASLTNKESIPSCGMFNQKNGKVSLVLNVNFFRSLNSKTREALVEHELLHAMWSLK